ncbi:MAG TPA: prefoldin subunit alpha [Acidobacteriota bacterium]|nr:prefoldin subunit alpha [Acidobacteriota bacterium]
MPELEAQMRHILTHLKRVDKQVQLTEQAIESITELKSSDEIMVPLAQGIFVKAKIIDTQHCVMQVGAGVAVQKPTADAVQVLSEQLEKTKDTQEQLTQRLAEISDLAEKAHEAQNVRVSQR